MSTAGRVSIRERDQQIRTRVACAKSDPDFSPDMRIAEGTGARWYADDVPYLLERLSALETVIRACIGDAEGQEAVRERKMLQLTKGQVQLLAAALARGFRRTGGDER